MESVSNSDNTFTNKDSINVNEECQELKNIKYKTMLLNGVPLHETKVAYDISNLDKFLEEEKNTSDY